MQPPPPQQPPPWAQPGWPPPMQPGPAPQRGGRGKLLAGLSALVAVLAATVVSFVVAHGSSSDGTQGQHGLPGGTSGAQHGSAQGPLTINGFRYVNACNAFSVAQTTSLFGSMTSFIRVSEVYAERIASAPPDGYLAPQSECRREPGDSSQKGVTTDLRLTQWDNVKVPTNDQKEQSTGSPLPGADGARIVHDHGSTVHFWHDNIEGELSVTTPSGSGPSDSSMTKALQIILAAAADPSSAAVVPVTRFPARAGQRADACLLFTAADYQEVTRYTTDTSEVSRDYTIGTSPEEFEVYSNACQRNSLSPTSGAAAPGTTLLDGGFDPGVELTYDATPAAAREQAAEQLSQGAVKVAGVGDVAYFRPDRGDPAFYVAKGRYVFEILVGVTNGTSSWTISKYETLLKGIATRVAARLP